MNHLHQRAQIVFLLAAIFAAGCNTTQSPHRQVDDARITAEIKAKLAQEITPSSLINVKVITTNGVVTLAGQVESPEVKQQAGQKANGVQGVVDVNNNLQVEPASAGLR